MLNSVCRANLRRACIRQKRMFCVRPCRLWNASEMISRPFRRDRGYGSRSLPAVCSDRHRVSSETQHSGQGMTYPVMLTDRAHVEMGAAYSWWAEHRSQAQASAVAHWWSAFLVPSPARLRGERVSSLLKNGCREGEAPAEPRETSDFPHAHGSAGAEPSLFQQTVRVRRDSPRGRTLEVTATAAALFRHPIQCLSTARPPHPCMLEMGHQSGVC